MAVSLAQIRVTDPVLAAYVIGALQRESAFKARTVLQVIPVGNADAANNGGNRATGTVFIDAPLNYMGDASVTLTRNPGGAIQQITQIGPTTGTYTCQSRSAKTEPVPKEHERRSQMGSIQRRAARALAYALRIQEERDFSTLLFSGAPAWLNSTVVALGGGGIQWNQAGATPIADLQIAAQTVRNNSHGVWPDTLCISQDVADVMCRNAEVRGFLIANPAGGQTAAASGERVMTQDAVVAVCSQILRIPNVHILGARWRSGIPPAVTEAFISTDECWLGLLKGGADDTEVSNGDVSMTAVAAAMFVEQEIEANIEWDPDTQSFKPWVDESYDMTGFDVNYGFRLRDVLA